MTEGQRCTQSSIKNIDYDTDLFFCPEFLGRTAKVLLTIKASVTGHLTFCLNSKIIAKTINIYCTHYQCFKWGWDRE